MDASSSRQGARENKVEDYRRYIPLLNASLRGDWDSAERFFDQDPRALTAHINDGKDTALHVAIRSGRSIEFVKKLVDLMMPPEVLALRNSSGCTALISAALYGNTKAAVIVAEKHPTSLYIRNDQNWLPLHSAANNGHKDNLLYLLSVTKEDHPVSKPFAYPSVALLLLQVIDSEFYDIALHLVGRYPELAMSMVDDGRHALKAMASKASAFPSGIRLNRWQQLIYSLSQKIAGYALESS